MKKGLFIIAFVLMIIGCGSSNSQSISPNSQGSNNSQNSSASNSNNSSSSYKEVADKIYEASQKRVNNLKIDNDTLKKSMNYHESKSKMPQQIPHIPKLPKLP